MAQRFLFLIVTLLILLAGCSSPPKTDRPVEPPPEFEEPLPPTVAQLLQIALDNPDFQQSQPLLLNVAQQWLQKGHAQEAGAVLVQIDTSAFSPTEIAQYRLAYAQFYAAIADWPALLNSLTDLEQQLTTREDRVLAMALRYQAFDEQNQHFEAATQLIELAPYVEIDTYTQTIWNHLRKVSAHTWRQSPTSRYALAQGWFRLLEQLTVALDTQTDITKTLNNWQIKFTDHPAQSIVEQLLQTPYLLTSPKKFAILLPLTGPYAKQGHAVRAGVLAAVTTTEWAHPPELLFFDTHKKEPEAILPQLEQEDVDYVIGPLDTDSLQNFLAQAPESTWLHLALNHAPTSLKTEPTLSSFFALDLAADTTSVAQSLIEQGKQGILMLAPDNDHGRQLSQLFQQYWAKNQPKGYAQTGFYKNSSDMRALVRNQLHVAQSEARKQRLENLILGSKIDMEFRSRNDIDAIYLLGGAAEARVLKPFIDVSISEFRSSIPVYANSIVHDEVQTMGESGLANIRFSDAPWLLPEAQQATLHQQLHQLFSTWPPSEQRLTAMGYDSVILSTKLGLMQYLEGYDHAGLSGQLRIDNNKLVRELVWAIFTKDNIALEPQQNASRSNRP